MGARARGCDTASIGRRARKHAEAVGGQKLSKLVWRRWDVGEVLAELEGHVQLLETKFSKRQGAWKKIWRELCENHRFS